MSLVHSLHTDTPGKKKKKKKKEEEVSPEWSSAHGPRDSAKIGKHTGSRTDSSSSSPILLFVFVWLLYCSSCCFPIVEFRYEESEIFASTRQTVAHRRLSLHSRKRSDYLSLQEKSTAWELIAPDSVFSFGWLLKGRNCVEQKTRERKKLLNCLTSCMCEVFSRCCYVQIRGSMTVMQRARKACAPNFTLTLSGLLRN